MKFLLLLGLLGAAYAQDSASLQSPSARGAGAEVRESFQFLLFYPLGYLFGVTNRLEFGTYALGIERVAWENWTALGEFTYRAIPLTPTDSASRIPGDMFAVKGAGRYYFSGRDGVVFAEPSLAFGYVPDGFPGSDLGASKTEEDQILVEKYVSAGLGLGLRTGNDGQSTWSLTLGLHWFIPLWTQMTGNEMDDSFEGFLGDILGYWLGDTVLPYRKLDLYVGLGRRF